MPRSKSLKGDVSLSAATYARLKKHSKATGEPMATVIHRLLADLPPVTVLS